MYEELGERGFVPFAVALDRSAEDVRPFVEKAGSTHPNVLDPDHHVAELYHIVNVPTLIWIDEAGRICRPHDSQFGTDTFTQFHGKRSGPYLDMIRAWVQKGEGALDAEAVRGHQPVVSFESQLARAEWALGWALHQRGCTDAAERHLERAGELAPGDWTIRRGSMPIRGLDPFGPAFFEMAREGAPAYSLESITPTRVETDGVVS